MSRNYKLNSDQNLSDKQNEIQDLTIFDSDLTKKHSRWIMHESKIYPDTCSFYFLQHIFSTLIMVAVSSAVDSLDIENRLHTMGTRLGIRCLDFLMIKERTGNRDKEGNLMNFLNVIAAIAWKMLFGRTAEVMRTVSKDKFLLRDRKSLLTRNVIVPNHFSDISMGSFSAGVLQGILSTSGFPCSVSAHTNENQSGVTYLCEFLPDVIQKQERLNEMGTKLVMS